MGVYIAINNILTFFFLGVVESFHLWEEVEVLLEEGVVSGGCLDGATVVKIILMIIEDKGNYFILDL